MMNNPEFRRNLWLELSPYRVIGMPAVLGAIYALVYVLRLERSHESLETISLVLFSVIIFLWGTRQAAESVVAELRDRTWDSQRMSSIGPWSMTWGKLLGSTIYPWYGGLLCLSAYALLSAGNPAQKTVNTASLFLACGFMAHAVALLSSMQAMKKDRRYNKSQASAFLILGVIFVGPMLSSALNRRQTVQWFGETFQNSDFILLSVVMFLVWAVVGIYRLMRTELQMRNGPCVWLAFTVFLALFFAGFVNATDPRELIFHRFFIAYAVMLSLTYLMAFSERKDPVAFRRLISAYGRRDWSRVMQELPCWAVTLPPALVAGGGMFVTVSANMVSLSPITDVRMFTAAMFLFLLRDLGLLLFFNLARNPKRADMIAALCLALLYGVVPGIVSALHFDSITSLFWPGWKNHSFLSVVAAAIEALLVQLLVFKRWRAHYGR